MPDTTNPTPPTNPAEAELLAQLIATLDILETELAQPQPTPPPQNPPSRPHPTTAPTTNTAIPDPGYPLETLPEPIATWVHQTAAATRVPTSMIAYPFLAFTGATIGNQLRIRITPTWHEYPALWIALITLTGMGKTPAIAAARAPFDLLHHEAWLDWKTQPSTNHTPLNPLIARGTSYTTLTTELLHSTGLILLRDELHGLIRNLERRRGEDRQNLLTLWSSEPILTHTTPIPAPVVSIVGGIQPTLIPHIRRPAHDGLLERFITLFVAGIQTPWHTPIPPLPPETIATLLKPLRTIPQAQHHPTGIPLILTTRAQHLWKDWYNTHIDHLHNLPLTLGNFYRKMPAHLLRLTLILHTLWNLQNPLAPISSTTLHRAIHLSEHTRHHIHRTATLLNTTHPLRTPQQALESRILHTLAQTPHQPTTRTDLLKRLGRPPTANVNQALATLTAQNRIQTTTTPPPKGTSGRHITSYHLKTPTSLSFRTK